MPEISERHCPYYDIVKSACGIKPAADNGKGGKRYDGKPVDCLRETHYGDWEWCSTRMHVSVFFERGPEAEQEMMKSLNALKPLVEKALEELTELTGQEENPPSGAAQRGPAVTPD